MAAFKINKIEPAIIMAKAAIKPAKAIANFFLYL
jgi:hypothetical protein